MPENDEELFEDIDAPRPLPTGLRDRLEASLLGEGGAAGDLPAAARELVVRRLTDKTAVLLAGVDDPRRLPDLARARIERLLLSAVRPKPPPIQLRPAHPGRWAVAAVVVTSLLSMMTATPKPSEFALKIPSGVGQSLDVRLYSDLAVVDDATIGSPGFYDPKKAVGTVTPRELTAVLEPAKTTVAAEPVPPFAFGDRVDDPPGPEDAIASGVPRPRPILPGAPPFRIALAGGGEAEAGFRAYVDLYNSVPRGRRFEVVGANEAADVTVNFSDTPLSALANGVGIESLMAPERVLGANVFNFAGSVERQAHLIVDKVYEQPDHAAAVIYQEPTGVLHDEVPAALRAALAEKGVQATMIDVVPGQTVPPVPGVDAVFLSLSATDAKRVVDAYSVAPRPPRGFNGIGTLAESTAVADLPPGTRFISPFAFPPSAEAAAVRTATGLPAGARLYHGWTVAKILAVAVWQRDPRTVEDLRVALTNMAYYANGFAPAYTYRDGTNSVQPQGALFEVGDGEAKQVGDFLTDD